MKAEINEGTLTLTFDKIPKLVFISEDGYGLYEDVILIDGKQVSNAKKITINSEIKCATEHVITFVTCLDEYKGVETHE